MRIATYIPAASLQTTQSQKWVLQSEDKPLFGLLSSSGVASLSGHKHAE